MAAAATARLDVRPPLGAGIGLRLPHLAEAAASPPAVAWVEVHPENFLANPQAYELLLGVREHRDIAVHTVGLSVGSADGIDREHLRRLRRFTEIEPLVISGHLAWSSYGGVYLNDLLPLPYDGETLRIVAEHVDEVQNALARAYVVENPASYVGFGTSTMEEAEFLGELARRTGCGLLCDVSNAYLSAANLRYDARAYLDALPAASVVELHLGGFTRERVAEPDDEVLIDTHAASIDAAVWDLYAHALRRFGPRPTLIEWDNDLPPLAKLVQEAGHADCVAAGVFLGEEGARASAG
jgi:uncharacterized protein (UPF0276 family)